MPSAERHSAILNELDATRLSLVKAINDTEGLLASKEAELSRLKEEIRVLEKEDPASEHESDPTAYDFCSLEVTFPKLTSCLRLRLAMYKGLGFEPILDKSGVVTKMLVRTCHSVSDLCVIKRKTLTLALHSGSESGDIHPVSFTDGKSDFEYAHLLWSLAES